ncbi:Protein ROT1 [Cyphellophora attinorum]|uniref:Protein ROT1 n=1 Tax=Cyphellophora attinorum TaxID=1664694 RepID=A0A0N1HRK7_9EURO|nr:Protein ROT1 [Phialophora attinorum]KPI38460.1 Protein ROT1 [Phialophora attinorum]
MLPSIHNLALLSLSLYSSVYAQYPDELVGTWVSKSRSVVTGPDFYDPVADKLIEPKHAGIAYSFTSDGFFEQSFYRSISNPTTPNCPSAMMQWQHGYYSLPGNGSIVLEPIPSDGRQLLSTPCTYDKAVYTRFDQPILLKSYERVTDAFHNVPRLNLFLFDGSPEQPLYLAYNPPQMLPTQTLNPTAAASQPTSRVKRDEDREFHERWTKKIVKGENFDHGDSDGLLLKPRPMRWDPDRWWWAGFGFLAIGTVMYMLPTKL